MNHTPTPWHTTGSSTNSDAPIYICGHVSTMMLPQDYRHVATVNREEELGWGEGLDNAAFILRACNSHDALVAALEIGISAYAGSRENWEKMKKTLKLAKGE